MIRSFVFSEGKLVGENIDTDALKLVRADKGLHIWVDLDNPTPEESKTILEELFNFHPLAIEDCLSPSHLPKIEDYEEYLFLVMHAVNFNRGEEDVFQTSELDFFIGKEFLVTHHTVPLRSIDFALERVKKNSVMVARAPDRLAHTILDAMVDNYQPVLQELNEEVQELEGQVFTDNSRANRLGDFLALKKQTARLRQIMRPQKEVLSRISHGEFKIIRPTLLPYFRDIYDNLNRIDDSVLNLNDQLFLAIDVYLNKSANESNEVIKVLTLLTAITTPTMIIGTWYGMNFEAMPELHTAYSYQVAWVVNIISTIGLVGFMKLKKWL